MVKYMTSFSEELRDLTPEEADWLEDQLAEICVFEDGTIYATNARPKGLAAKRPQYRGPRYLYGTLATVGETCNGFDYKFLHDRRTLWLYAEDNGDTENVIRLVQAFLRRFRPQDYWVLRVATTCTRPLVGAFGGRIIVVLANAVRYFCTDEASRVAPLIASSTYPHVAIISVRDGTVAQVAVPPGMKVILVDWDTETVALDDPAGARMQLSAWAHNAWREAGESWVVELTKGLCATVIGPVLCELGGEAEKSSPDELVV